MIIITLLFICKYIIIYFSALPYIEGYVEGETIRRGQTVELVCRCRGGNPPAQLIWYKNGEQIRMAYRTAGRLSENVYTFTADASDNKAKYKCEASNVMSKTSLKAEVEMRVLCKLMFLFYISFKHLCIILGK